ncbi:unnamed protein product [Enterobius vermicularis]|uniref:CPG4 domain-containing protein n=1 Tax=Enterobius vermicularis TaxID=51028 RepID=A0A0N4V3N2_ENTVE|nr:unnamed protein product [Enterobius vermicularis]
MAYLTYLIRLILLFILVQRTSNLPFYPQPENSVPDESALQNLLENLKNFNVSNLFASFRLPGCVQDCVNELGSTLASMNIEERWSLEKTKALCKQFEAMKKCLATKPNCRSMMIDIGMHAYEYLCKDDEANAGLIPCIRRETLKIHATCERVCKLGATLLDAASMNSRSHDVLNFLDEKGNKILSVPDLHQLCNSSTCFLSCMRAGIEEKCPNGGSAFVDIILTTPGAPFTFVTSPYIPVMVVTTVTQTTPKVSTGVVLEMEERNSEDEDAEYERTRRTEGKEKGTGSSSQLVPSAAVAALAVFLAQYLS